MKDECTLIATAGKLTAEAVTKADVTLCKKIELERFRTACETQVKPLVEAKQADAERLKIEQQAIDQQDAKLCDQIKIEGQRTSCKYNILANQAIQKKDPSLCNAIGEKTGIERCKQNVQ